MRGLILAAMLVLVTPAFAQNSAAAGMARMQAGMDQLAQEARRYDTIMVEALNAGMVVNPLIEQAQQMAVRGASREEVDRWVAGWRPQLQSRLDDIESRTAALGQINVARLEPFLASSPDGRKMLASMKQRPARTVKLVQTMLQHARDMSELLPPAANGEPSAVTRLGLASIESGALVVEVETVNIESAIAGLPDNHPQNALMRAMLATSKALLEAYDAVRDEALGDNDEIAASGRRIEAFGFEAISAAEETPALTQQALRVVRSTAGGTEYAAKLSPALQTYPASAEIEKKLAEQIVKLGRAAQERRSIIEAYGEVAPEITRLGLERIKLDQQRKALMAR